MKSGYWHKQYWKHLFQARHRHGHGVHSPFLFDLIVNVIEEKWPYYCYEEIERTLLGVFSGEKPLSGEVAAVVSDMSVVSSTAFVEDDSFRQMISVKKMLPSGDAQLLFRLIHFWKPASFETLALEKDLRAHLYVAAALDAFTPLRSARHLQVLNLPAMRGDALAVIGSKFASEYVSGLGSEKASESGLETGSVACGTLDDAPQMVILLQPYANAATKACWQEVLRTTKFPVVLDVYGLAILIDAPHLPHFRSILVY